MTASAPQSPSTSDRELVTTRLIRAPRSLVWKVWTDPEHLAQWWGPKGFSNTFDCFELRPGGEWRFVMHGPDGTDYKNRIVFEEIVPEERLVFDHTSGPRFKITATFVERGDQTEVTFRGVFQSAAEFDAAKGFAVEGNRETFDRMEDLVALLNEPAFTLRRTFNAPRKLVWKAYTEAERLAQWWGPKGFELKVIKLDLRPGGLFHYAMTAPNGHQMWGKFIYRDLVAPQRMVFVVSFSDPEGGISRHPLSATWPLEMLNLLSLEETDGRTNLTLRCVSIHATEEERRTFAEGFSSMQQGYTGTLDQLEAFLEKGDA